MINIIDYITKNNLFWYIVAYIIVFIVITYLITADNRKAHAQQPDKVAVSVMNFRSSTTTTTAETVAYYQIDLSPELQDYVFELCKANNLDTDLVLAIMYQESHFIPSKVNRDCKGLMQIKAKYYKGDEDLMNPYVNIKVGVQMLANLYQIPECDGELDRVILAYNNGIDGLKGLDKQGIISTPYLMKVLVTMENLKGRRAT